MKVLSVRQPYASLVICGVKDIENRSWSTTYRGELGIHASKTMTYRALEEDSRLDAFELEDLPTGVILGTVILTDCLWDASNSEWADSTSWHWYFERPKQYAKPILAKGTTGLWNW